MKQVTIFSSQILVSNKILQGQHQFI